MLQFDKDGIQKTTLDFSHEDGFRAGIEWEKRDALILGKDGEVIFQQKNVEFPAGVSQNCVNIVSQKYFWGDQDLGERESSLADMIERVSTRIMDWATDQKYFANLKSKQFFYHDLCAVLAMQLGAFNSPVWFNIGVDANPQQASACFLLKTGDTLEEIMQTAADMSEVFRGGSGEGCSLSKIRSSYEKLTGGGKPSGPLSFLKIWDTTADVIKSGGKSRRAAMFHGLHTSHPDIEEFVVAKAREECKQYMIQAAASAIKSGSLKLPSEIQDRVKAYVDSVTDWDSMDGEATKSTFFQNMNVSVWAEDEFMEAVISDADWPLKAVSTDEVVKTISASDLFDQIAQCAWECADPGVMFDGHIQAWHTTPVDGPISTCNPCSEYLSQDDTACNLASINLLKIFLLSDCNWNVFVNNIRRIVQILYVAQDIFVDQADYPTEDIRKATLKYRNIGFGIANLGGLLFFLGIPYDSDAGRNLAQSIASLVLATCVETSMGLAKVRGAFPRHEANHAHVDRVIRKHADADSRIKTGEHPWSIVLTNATCIWEDILKTADENGFLAPVANSQFVVYAPTGTISILMDCDTTGVEPVLAHQIYKRLAGGGGMMINNPLVDDALVNLRYSKEDRLEMLKHLEETGNIIDHPKLREADVDVFRTAFGSKESSISPMGHLKMVAALAPFVSGSISKTINLPSDATVKDIQHAYLWAWQHGIKGISIYRDGSKFVQALYQTKTSTSVEDVPALPDSKLVRKNLPDDVPTDRHKFSIGGHEGIIHIGRYEDDTIGEIFFRMYKEGSTVSGLLDSMGILLSWCAQHGILTSQLLDKLRGSNFEPQGITRNPNIRFASSIPDYLANFLEDRYPGGHRLPEGVIAEEDVEAYDGKSSTPSGTACPQCGSMLRQAGTCQQCDNCGFHTGCG